MSGDRPSIPPTRPTQFVVREDEHGAPMLDIIEGTFEHTYRVLLEERRSEFHGGIVHSVSPLAVTLFACQVYAVRCQ